MNKIWEDDFNNLYKDFEDIQKHCEYLERENKDLQKKAELADHYKHLYSEVKKQKEELKDILKIKLARYRNEEDYYLTIEDFEDLLRMLGEIDNE